MAKATRPLVLTEPGLFGEDTPGQGAFREEKARTCQRLLGDSGKASLLWADSPLTTKEVGRGRGLKMETGAEVPANPSPSLPLPPLQTQSPGPTCQPDRGGWWLGLGGPWHPASSASTMWLPGGIWATKWVSPRFPLLIRPSLLISSCHLCSIIPPKPSAPQHLAGDPRGALAAGTEAHAGGGTPGWRWGGVSQSEAGLGTLCVFRKVLPTPAVYFPNEKRWKPWFLGEETEAPCV